MPERLTTQLEDGTIEKLRELAGGERKVGAFLTEVITWLYMYRDRLASAPLPDFVLRSRHETDEQYRQETADLLAQVKKDIRQWTLWREESDAKRSEDERRIRELFTETRASLQRMEVIDATVRARLQSAGLGQDEERQEESDDKSHGDADNENNGIRPA